jgi:hypothetical protein
MIRRLIVIVAVGSALSACSSPAGPTAAPPTVAETTSGSTSAAATAGTPGTPAATTATRERGTAHEGIAPFLDQARRVDARLRHAAALINAGIGDDLVRVDATTAEAVRAAEPDAAARAVPPGLPREILRRTLVVYNDLVARRAAMRDFQRTGSYARTGDAAPMLQCLAGGAAPASRFAADLGSLERYAHTQPASTPADQPPEAAAELAVRLQLIGARNECADECGSAVFTDLAKLTWTVRPTASRAGHGTLEGATFTVTPKAHAWVVRFNAC